jgi:hypothetical protein
LVSEESLFSGGSRGLSLGLSLAISHISIPYHDRASLRWDTSIQHLDRGGDGVYDGCLLRVGLSSSSGSGAKARRAL